MDVKHIGLWAMACLSGAAAGGGCAGPSGTVRIGYGRTLVVYDPRIDRVVYFGRGGPNALHVTADVYRPPTPGRYVFRGCAYTWIAPQSRWLKADGSRTKWPPEPLMDTGPAAVRRQTKTDLLLMGPCTWRNTRERKRFTVDTDESVGLDIALLPVGGREPDGELSIWSTTAVPPGAILAVPKGKTRAAKDALAAAWRAAATDDGPWQLVDTGKIAQAGKVFIDGPPVVAAWWKGQWFVRVGSDGPAARRSPENAVLEIYVARDAGIIELEMIAPLRPVDAAGGNRWSETWRIIPAKAPTVADLADALARSRGR